MIVVYPLILQNDYSELRYSLRSIEKYLQKPFEVVIVGEMVPDWINNITQIELPDVPSKKQLSIRRKILAALEYSKEILFLNDDIFFLKHWTEFPYYFHGMLKHVSESGTRQVEKRLTELNKPVKHFDGHMPIVYKQDFKQASEHFDESCIIKSLYCNYNEIEGELVSDCKLLTSKKPEYIKEFIRDRPCFSTGMYSIKEALPVLQELFPNKSKFEL